MRHNRHSSIAVRAGGAYKCRQVTEEEVTFFQKSELSVGEEVVVVSKDTWAETGKSRCHLQLFTTWSHHWLVIESIPGLELGISSQNVSLDKDPYPIVRSSHGQFSETCSMELAMV